MTNLCPQSPQYKWQLLKCKDLLYLPKFFCLMCCWFEYMVIIIGPLVSVWIHKDCEPQYAICFHPLKSKLYQRRHYKTITHFPCTLLLSCENKTFPFQRHLFVYVDSLCYKSFKKSLPVFLLEKGWKQSIVSDREKEKEKGTDGIGRSIRGGRCKLAFKGEEMSRGMFLEREDEGNNEEDAACKL